MRYFIIFTVIFLFSSCDEDAMSPSELLQQMAAIEGRINEITSLDCQSDESCKAMPIGTKACGGPTHFIIYGSVTSQSELNTLVLRYNALNKQYNEQTEAISNCALEVAPNLACVDAQCEVVVP